MYPGGLTSTISYDTIKFTTESKDVEGTTIRETADRFGRVIKKELKDNNSYIVQWLGSFDAVNRLLSVQDGKNYVTTYRYDPLGQITRVTGADQFSYQYQYNRQGQMTAMVSPNEEVTLKEYDQLGRVIRVIDPLEQEKTYTYDGNGNVIQYKDKKGQLFTNTYNSRNFLTTRSGPSESVQYTYSAVGLRKTMTDNGNRLTRYNYDVNTGELDSITYPDGKMIDYSYDSAGRIESVTTPFLDKIKYGYDAANRLKTVAWNGVTQATYNFVGAKPLQSISQANGVITSYTYDGVNRMKEISSKLGITELRKNTYAYDMMNRISTSSLFNETYAYDSNGNRKSVETDNDAYTPSSASYEYDQWNRLKKVTTANNQVVEYVYNGDDLMVERKENGVITRYYYDGAKIIAEGIVGVSNTVTPKASYLYGSKGLIMREDATNDSKAYYLANGHGDITEIRDASGVLLNRYTYDIWGNILSETGNLDNPFLYSGEYWDDTTNLQYLRARWYDPSIGRFINEDTYEGDITNPLSLNLYTYTYNNPLIYKDPSGNVVETIIDVASIGWSAYDLYKNPSWKNVGFLLWDIGAAFLPFVPGSYTVKGAKMLMKADDFVKAPTGVWAKKPFDRGWEIEKALGGMMNNFPTIDKFTTGTKGIASSITSIKSLDVTAKSYQKGNNFYNALKGYVDSLANFSTTTYGGLTVRVNQNTSRVLELALPPVQLTKSQADQLAKITSEASKQGISIVVKIVE